MIATDLLELATKAGAMPMQVLLLVALILLSFVVRHLHTDTKKSAADFMERIDKDRASIALERKETAATVIGLVRDDIETKAKLAHAIDINTTAINDMREFIRALLSNRK